MDTEARFAQMQKVLQELEDLKNNQTEIIKKVSEIEEESIELTDTQLEMKLADLYESVAMNVEKVETAFSFYQQKLDEFAIVNHLQVGTMQ
jgi:predicted nucleic acid-binding protein